MTMNENNTKTKTSELKESEETAVEFFYLGLLLINGRAVPCA